MERPCPRSARDRPPRRDPRSGRDDDVPGLGAGRCAGGRQARGREPTARSRARRPVCGRAASAARRGLRLRPGRRPRIPGSLLAVPARGDPRAVAGGRATSGAAPRLVARRPRRLRAPRRDVLGGGDVRWRCAVPRRAPRARGDGDRADARRDLSRGSRLGLRRRLRVRAAPRLRRPGGAGPARRRRARRRPGSDRRRGLQPPRPRIGGADRVRSLPERGRPDVLGSGSRLLPGGRPRMVDPERALLGRGLRDRRPTARRRSRDPRSFLAHTSSTNSPAACTRRPRTRS